MKTLKALTLVFLGLIIWTALNYIAFAFLKAELNPFIWSQNVRFAMLFMEFAYVLFSPLMVMHLEDKM